MRPSDCATVLVILSSTAMALADLEKLVNMTEMDNPVLAVFVSANFFLVSPARTWIYPMIAKCL